MAGPRSSKPFAASESEGDGSTSQPASLLSSARGLSLLDLAELLDLSAYWRERPGSRFGSRRLGRRPLSEMWRRLTVGSWPQPADGNGLLQGHAYDASTRCMRSVL